MSERLTLQELVRAKFKTYRVFAQKLGWNYSKTCRILRGEQDLDLNEVRAISEKLGLRSAEEVAQVFSIPFCSQNGTA